MRLEKLSTSGSQYQMLDIETVRTCANTPQQTKTIIKRKHATAFGMMCQPRKLNFIF